MRGFSIIPFAKIRAPVCNTPKEDYEAMDIDKSNDPPWRDSQRKRLANRDATLFNKVSSVAMHRWGGSSPTVLEFTTHAFYLFRRGSERCVLRVTRSDFQSFDSIVAEIEWVDYLNKNGAFVCRPVRSMHCRLVERVSLERWQFSVVAFEEISGRRLMPDEVWERRRQVMWGSAIGIMHRKAKSYTPLGPRRFTWHERGIIENAPRCMRTLPHEKKLALEYSAVTEYLNDLPKNRDNFGLVHSDLHPWNFYIKDEKLLVFDFDNCMYHWFMFDLAVPVYLVSYTEHFSNGTPVGKREFMDALIEGYAREMDQGGCDFSEFQKNLAMFVRLYRLYRWVIGRLHALDG